MGVGSPKQRLTRNLDAIRTLKSLESAGRLATPEEQRTLAQYVGWGGLPNAFNPKHKAYSPELRDLLTDEEYEAARASTPNAHYTSLTVIDGVYRGLEKLGVTGGLRMLEPAAGVGHFLGMMPAAMASAASRQAVELDAISGRITTALYPRARVHVMGFQDAPLPDGAFDLIVSNVPFGNYQVADKAFSTRPRTLTSSIHNYYFAKALDLTRPGGVVAFITSRYTMDAHDTGVRRYLAERAELLWAVRLPFTAFKGNANTEVVTDILFLQKRPEVETGAAPSWVESAAVTLPDGAETFHVNRYFEQHPEQILGRQAATGTMQMRPGGYNVEPTGNLETQLRDAMDRLPRGPTRHPRQSPRRPPPPPSPPSASVPPGIRDHAWFEQDGRLYVNAGGSAVAVDLPKDQIARVRRLIRVRDAVRDTLATMLSSTATDAQVTAAQKRLNTAYDGFVRVHGYLAKPSNFRSLRDDPDVFTLLALEEWGPKAAKPTKAAIFTTRTLRPHAPVESVDTPKEALMVSLNERGGVDWPRMAELTGRSVEDLQQSLDGLVYHDPYTDTWEQADRYLSGNVKAKLAAAQEAARTKPEYQANVEILEKVQPPDLEPTDIAVRIGSPWVPHEVIEDFASHLGLPGLQFRYSPALAKWSMDTRRFHGAYSVQNTAQWGTARKSAASLLESSLNLGDPVVYDTVEDNTRVVNQTETLAAREKQVALQEEFRAWVWEDAARATRLARIYNDTMNTMRLWEPDGAHLTLPGANPLITFRPHQKNFIWRGLQQPNALAHHVVGAGKTFAGIALAMEKRRLGLARKPLVVVPNHLVQQWARDVLRLYPAARVLASAVIPKQLGTS